jgi:hypothetical protein
MKNFISCIWLAMIVLTACKDDDNALFEKTADERVAEAISNLKQDLVAPANGWRVKYRPEAESGSFYVLMDFNEDNTITIKSDLAYNEGEFFEKTGTYRIDNSLGLELIIESYSFFSFLLEQGAATFPAEYEFNFVNKTPDNALVFNSKTDLGTKTILLFEEATGNDPNLLGGALATNINTLAGDFEKFSSSLQMVYENKNLIFYVVLDEFRRTIGINTASRKTNLSSTQEINFSTPYIIKGDSLVFDDRFTGTVLGNNISIKGLKFSTLSESTLSTCTDPTVVHSYSGFTSSNDAIRLETSLSDVGGNSFVSSDFYVGPLNYIYSNGEWAGAQIQNDVAGAAQMQLYYNYNLGGGNVLYGIGFYLQNAGADPTFALWEFTPALDGNNIVFNFAPEITPFGNPNPDADISKIYPYLEALAQGGTTYVFKIEEGVFEFFNPCTESRVVFIDANQ